MKKGYIVLFSIIGGWQPCFATEETEGSNESSLMFFVTEGEAQAEIDDCIKGVDHAIKKGYMDRDSKETRADYKIVPATI